MEISKISKFEQESFKNIDFDLVVISSGYEERSSFLIRQQSISGTLKICLCHKSFSRSLSRVPNDKEARKQGFKLLKRDGNLDETVEKLISNYLEELNLLDKKELDILIDFTSMTRVWYSSILKSVINFNTKKKVNLHFSYSTAEFTQPPLKPSKNEYVGPLKGFNNISIPTIPTALIIGLGYIEERSFGLTEYLDAVPFVFLTDDSNGNMFSKTVETNNKALLDSTGIKNTYRYPIDDMELTYYLLKELCFDLSSDYRTIIASCGPKPFSLVSLLIATKMNNVDIWRISAGDEAKPTNKIANGQLSLLKVVFINN